MAAKAEDTVNLDLGFYQLSIPSNINPQSMLRLATMAGVEEGNLAPDAASDVAMKALNSKASSINGVGQTRAWIKIAIKDAYEAVTGVHIPSQFSEQTQENIYRAFQTSFWRNVHVPSRYAESLREKPNNELNRLTGITQQQIGKVLEILKDKFYDTRERPNPHQYDERESIDPCYNALDSLINAIESSSTSMKESEVHTITQLIKEYFKLKTQSSKLPKEGLIVRIALASPFCAEQFAYNRDSHPLNLIQAHEAKSLFKEKIAFEIDNDFGPPSVVFDPIVYAYSRLSHITEVSEARKFLKAPDFLAQLKLLQDQWEYF